MDEVKDINATEPDAISAGTVVPSSDLPPADPWGTDLNAIPDADPPTERLAEYHRDHDAWRQRNSAAGTIQPGDLTAHLTIAWRDSTAIIKAARTVTDMKQASRETAAQLVDWFARPHPPGHEPKWYLVRAAIVDALATALGLSGAQRRQRRNDEALRLKEQGWEAPAIAKALGLTDRHVRRLYNDARAERANVRLWPDADAVMADVRNEADRETLIDAVCWFADRDRAVPYHLWWTAMRLLGVGNGLQGKTPTSDVPAPKKSVSVSEKPIPDKWTWLSTAEAYDDVTAACRRLKAAQFSDVEQDLRYDKALVLAGCQWLIKRGVELNHFVSTFYRRELRHSEPAPFRPEAPSADANAGWTAATIRSRWGRDRPDAYSAAARLVGEARAKERYSPYMRTRMRAILARAEQKTITPSSRKRLMRIEAVLANYTGVKPLTVNGLARSARVTRPAIYEWLAGDEEWQAACDSYETMARVRGRTLARREAARLVGVARADYPADTTFADKRVGPLSVEDIVLSEAVAAHAYVDRACAESWIADEGRWNRDCDLEEVAARRRGSSHAHTVD